MRFVTIVLGLVLSLGAAQAQESDLGQIQLTQQIGGLDAPWAFGFLPGGDVLITEKDGRVLRLREGALTEISGVPEVAFVGQGGLLDLLVPRDFAQSRELFFTYAKPQSRGAGTALARAQLDDANNRLTGWQDIFELEPGSSGGRHFGSRIVEGTDGFLYVTIGDRGDRPSAQDLQNQNGTVIRVSKTGEIPSDNPFVDDRSAQPEIWSYGHRNPQGAAMDLDGRIWVAEHGARGGDEINLIRKGANFGWPVISYGTHYSGAKIGEGTEKAGMEQPEFYWDPSIAPSGMMFYSGKLWPEWKGDIFVGSLKFDYISRLSGEPLREVAQISSPETIRIRDVREAPDGSIWFLSIGQGALYRLAPQ